ncbi:hypothetical protein ACTPD5_21210, partial [Clostridioides difficile]|uniref:hypothetical protein n=1 Tax=Clostridioides difficile TaxID=1496 RepID=UPI003F8D8B2D
TFANIRGRFVFAVIIMALFSPFLYIVGFTRWLSKRFVKNINQLSKQTRKKYSKERSNKFI